MSSVVKPLDFRRVRRGAPGFTFIEATISLAVISVALIGFLTFMTSSVQVSKEEVTESEAQTESRKLTEEVINDINASRLVYLPTTPTLGANVFSQDTDDGTKSFLLCQYQVPPRSSPDGTANWDTAQPYGAFQPGAANTTDGAWYALVFRQTGVLKENDPMINRDLDGDGALNTSFALGRIERRYYPAPFASGPLALNNPYLVERVYPAITAIELDPAGAPKNSVFSWIETPSNVKNDGIYHDVPNSPGYLPSPTLQNGHWNALLSVTLRFIDGSGDSRRIKLVHLNINVNNQTVR